VGARQPGDNQWTPRGPWNPYNLARAKPTVARRGPRGSPPPPPSRQFLRCCLDLWRAEFAPKIQCRSVLAVQQVCVDGQREGRRVVAERARQLEDVRATGQHEARVGVAERVERRPRRPDFLRRASRLASGDCPDRAACRRASKTPGLRRTPARPPRDGRAERIRDRWTAEPAAGRAWSSGAPPASSRSCVGPSGAGSSRLAGGRATAGRWPRRFGGRRTRAARTAGDASG
jgi:hypothetical protein